jgi:uncharacterized protein
VGLRTTILLLALLLAACGGEEERSGPQVLIDTGDEQVSVQVEIADDDEERRVGLMHRESLEEEEGMLFLFPVAHRGGFWMKDTLIPLSIAFVDSDGRILRILDMTPCRADPCRIYDPGVAYRSALEVNRGTFSRWGVEEGDLLRLER